MSLDLSTELRECKIGIIIISTNSFLAEKDSLQTFREEKDSL